MKKTIAALLPILLLLQACAFIPVSVRNRSTSIANRMEASSVLMREKLELTLHDEDTGETKVVQGWGSCSAVYIDDNILLSAAHCVKPFDKDLTIKGIWIKNNHGESAVAVPFKVDTQADLSLLYTPLDGTPIQLADEVVKGQDIWIVGNPLGITDVITHGIISNPYAHDPKAKASFLVLDAVALPGNSGGPVVNTNCELVGILTRGTSMLGPFGASGLGLAVDLKTIKAFLESK